MPTKPEDVSVAWGQQRSQADMAMERWWHAIYQDMVPSFDGSKLYFLYDQSVEGRGNYQCIAVFDPNSRRFIRDIQLNIQEGRVKYFYLVKPNEFALFVQNEDYSGACILWMFSLILSPDGMNIAQMRCVIPSLNVGTDWIIGQAQDTVVLISGPGLVVFRLSTDRGVIYSYTVPGANIKNYFDATLFGGVIYLFPSLPDENLDFTHLHTIDMEGRAPMRPFSTKADPQNGFPGVRKQCALDIWQGRLYVAGGQLDDPNRGTFRYGDVWALDLRSLQWQRVPLQLPILMVEPRMHIAEHSGLCFLWGDCDMAQGCYTNRRHFHAMRLYMGDPPPQGIPQGSGAYGPPTGGFDGQQGGGGAYGQPGGGGAYGQQGGGPVDGKQAEAYGQQGGGGANQPGGGAYGQPGGGGAYNRQAEAYGQQGGGSPQLGGGGAYGQQGGGGAYGQQGGAGTYGGQQISPGYTPQPPSQPEYGKTNKKRDCSIM